MKKHTANPRKNNAGKTILHFAFAGLLASGFLPAVAQNNIRSAEPPLQVKYLGVTGGQPLFQIDIDNENEDAYTLTIKGDDGTMLYTEKLKEKKFSKKIKWDNTDPAVAKLIFTLSGDKDKRTQAFEINTSLREVRDVVITKL